jgi:hypothetical protein
LAGFRPVAEDGEFANLILPTDFSIEAISRGALRERDRHPHGPRLPRRVAAIKNGRLGERQRVKPGPRIRADSLWLPQGGVFDAGPFAGLIAIITFGCIYGLIFAAIFGFLYGLIGNVFKLRPVEKTGFDFTNIWARTTATLRESLRLQLILWLIFVPIFWLTLGLIQGAYMGFVTALFCDGVDDVAPFVITGRFDVATNAAYWTKAYVGMHTVEYSGLYCQRAICGDWTWMGHSGGFWIWPEFETVWEQAAEDVSAANVVRPPDATSFRQPPPFASKPRKPRALKHWTGKQSFGPALCH